MVAWPSAKYISRWLRETATSQARGSRSKARFCWKQAFSFSGPPPPRCGVGASGWWGNRTYGLDNKGEYVTLGASCLRNEVDGLMGWKRHCYYVAIGSLACDHAVVHENGDQTGVSL